MLPEVIYWRGAGWYASVQEGAHENQRIVTRWFSADPDNQPDTYGSAGTPFFIYEQSDFKARNPEARIEELD